MPEFLQIIILFLFVCGLLAIVIALIAWLVKYLNARDRKEKLSKKENRTFILAAIIGFLITIPWSSCFIYAKSIEKWLYFDYSVKTESTENPNLQTFYKQYPYTEAYNDGQAVDDLKFQKSYSDTFVVNASDYSLVSYASDSLYVPRNDKYATKYYQCLEDGTLSFHNVRESDDKGDYKNYYSYKDFLQTITQFNICQSIEQDKSAKQEIKVSFWGDSSTMHFSGWLLSADQKSSAYVSNHVVDGNAFLITYSAIYSDARSMYKQLIWQKSLTA
jgi:hypothetical protein